jgi:hypothetical protein
LVNWHIPQSSISENPTYLQQSYSKLPREEYSGLQSGFRTKLLHATSYTRRCFRLCKRSLRLCTQQNERWPDETTRTRRYVYGESRMSSYN